MLYNRPLARRQPCFHATAWIVGVFALYNLSLARRQPCFHATAWIIGVFACVLTVLLAGCGKSAKNGLAPVSGHVRLDGQPLAGASITFQSDAAQVPGITDKNGAYDLKPAAAPGEYRVVISKIEGSDQAMLAVDPGAIGRVQPSATPVGPPKQSIPVRYSDPVKTELRFTVGASGTTRADFDLTTKK